MALSAFLAGRALAGAETARTMAFATIALAELGVLFCLRDLDRPAWRVGGNRLLVSAVAGSAALVLAAVYAPRLGEPFATVALGPAEVGIVAALALVPFAAIELAKSLRRRRGRVYRDSVVNDGKHRRGGRA
jgi:magnesium-transporting ATPase (P-type)